MGAGLLTPWLTVPEASAAQPTIEQLRLVRKALAPTDAPAPATVRSRKTTSPPRTTAPTAGPTTSAPVTGSTPSAPSAAPTTAPAPAPTSTVAPVASAGNPLGGMTFYGPNFGARTAAAQSGRSPEDAAALAELARVPTSMWLGAWNGDVTATVRQVVADARVAGAVPVFVLYNIPNRDCGGYSSGGVDSSAAYRQWVQAVAAGIGTATAVVVVEPDALAQLCGDPAERLALLRSAVGVLEANAGTHTYLDAGHANWIGASTMADRLRSAGVTGADGFALNVSNFQTTDSNVAYGRQVSSLLGGAHFVIDTSRNGNGPGTDWCNPPGRAVGTRPTAQTGQTGVDAYLWIKKPGESDGTCNGGPAAGVFWDSYAIGLMRGV
jgi:endoglucanase